MKYLPTSSQFNHIVPLIPTFRKHDFTKERYCLCNDTIVHSKVHMKEIEDIREAVSETCLMEKLEQCGVGKVKEGDINWVQCSLWSGWYHCVCVGMAHGKWNSVVARFQRAAQRLSLVSISFMN